MRSGRVLEFDEFTVDFGSRLLLLGERPIALTPKAFDLLATLLEHPGEVVTKEEILVRVWPDTFVEDGVLTQNIYTLRKAFQEAGGPRSYIETIPRRGYRFAGPVAAREAAGEPREPWQPRQTTPREAVGAISSLAVLPFEPLGANSDDAYLGLGLADALITRLSNLRRISVRPTSAVRRYIGIERDPAAVGRLLQVEAVLDGTIHRSGDLLRISVQLVSVRDGSPVWATRFDARSTDLFALEDSISQQLAEELRLRLTHQERVHLTRSATRNPEAYDSYLRGRYFWNRRTHESLGKAIDLFRHAIDLDPGFALAYAGMADCRVLLPLYGAVAPGDSLPLAIAAAERALELDDSLAEAHTSLAYARFLYERRWEEAESGFQRALELSPGYATAHQWYAFLLSALGRHREAVARAREARDLDPLSLIINADLGMVLCFARNPGAVAQLSQTLDLDPGFAYARFGLGLALQQQGRLVDAAGELGLASSMSPDSPAMQAALGQVLAQAGHLDQARDILAGLEERAAREPVEASLFAFLWIGLGERDLAIDALEKACDEGSRFVVFLATWSLYDPLRDHPRWPALLRRAGLGAVPKKPPERTTVR